MDIETVRKDFEDGLKNAKLNNIDISQYISNIAGDDKEIKNIMETINTIMELKDKMENGETDNEKD